MADWNRITEQKEAYRASAAALPSDQKLAILDQLHERAQLLRVGRGPITDGLREPEGAVWVHLVTSWVGAHHAPSGDMNVLLLGANASLVSAIVDTAATNSSGQAGKQESFAAANANLALAG